jgi:hypothetical protein
LAAARAARRLTLRCALDLDGMLRPRVQPGAAIDYAWPDESVTIEASRWSAAPRAQDGAAGARRARAVRGGRSTPAATAGAAAAIDVAWHTAEDARPRAFELRRIVQPWAAALGGETGTASAAPEGAAHPSSPAATGRAGAPSSSARTRCAPAATPCATAAATARRGQIGPDLLQCGNATFASLRRDVFSPSAAINPDHLAWSFQLRDGPELVGVAARTLGDGGSSIVVGEAGGKETSIRPRRRREARAARDLDHALRAAETS